MKDVAVVLACCEGVHKRAVLAPRPRVNTSMPGSGRAVFVCVSRVGASCVGRPICVCRVGTPKRQQAFVDVTFLYACGSYCSFNSPPWELLPRAEARVRGRRSIARGRRPGVGTHPASGRPGVGPGSGLIWAPHGPGTTFTMSPRGVPPPPRPRASVMYTSA